MRAHFQEDPDNPSIDRGPLERGIAGVENRLPTVYGNYNGRRIVIQVQLGDQE
jgi:hypothetical protein